MNTKNDITKRRESVSDVLDDVSMYYGLIWQTVKPGILVYNGTEYFLLKLKDAKVRKLYHQNHNRTIKQITLPCDIEEIDNTIIQNYFHPQKWKDTDKADLKRTLVYIYHHGKARRILDSQRKALIKSAFA